MKTHSSSNDCFSDEIVFAFIQEYRIRALDVEKYKGSKALQQDCAAFSDKAQQLETAVKSYLDVLDRQV